MAIVRRDGFNESIWQSGIAAYHSGQQHSVDLYDVILAGGGITGITTAYELQKGGQHCLILEAQNLCFGTTAGTTAHINNFFDKSYDEVEKGFNKKTAMVLAAAANHALALVKQHIEDLDIDCDYRESPGVLYALDKKQAGQLEKLYEASRRAGIDVEPVNEIPVPVPFKKAIRFKGQGQFHPVKYVYGMANAFESAGGNILQNCFVQDVKEGRILEVQTTRGVFKTKKLIYATHIPPGVNMLHMRCAPYRSYVMAAELKNNAYPEFPAYDMKDPYHYYRTQEMGGKKYLIAGGEDHKTGHEKDTDLPFDRLGSYLKRYFKIKNIAFQWSSQYFDPADGLAYIGHLPGSSDNIFVATGFGGNGMTYSHIAAKVLSTLIISGNHEYENIFNPGRIKPVAGFSNFIKENSDVVSSFVGDRIDMYKSSSLAGLRNGTGRVIKKPGHSPLGVSKDEIGKIHAIDPVCTHLKCIVQWNKTEKSWDCPCHGARYSMDGEVLNAPGTVALASAPTEKKELDDKSAGEKVLADK